MVFQFLYSLHEGVAEPVDGSNRLLPDPSKIGIRVIGRRKVTVKPGKLGKGFMHFPWQLQYKSALVKIIVPVHVPTHREYSFFIFKNVVAVFPPLPRKGFIMHVSAHWGRKTDKTEMNESNRKRSKTPNPVITLQN